MSDTKCFDTVVVGAGPAGLTAAIYLARFNRSVLVVERGKGRTENYELNENYFGFPNGVHARQLVELGKKQATRFGVQFVHDSISTTQKRDNLFILEGEEARYEAKSVILATGVKDLFPNIPNFKDYLGTSLFWCITCDGYKTIGKKIIVVGDSDETACTALQFLQYTPNVTVVTNYKTTAMEMSEKWQMKLKDRQIPFYPQVIAQVSGQNQQITSVKLEDGTTLQTDMVFSMQGAVPNNSLATELGVLVNGEGYIETDDEQRTNIPFVYAAGDVTRRFSHQIITAAHEGSMAAQAANYDLYDPDQRME